MNKIALLLVAASLAALAGFAFFHETNQLEESAAASFEEFTIQFGKSYSSLADRALRFQVFQANLKRINAHNRDPTATYTQAVNEFADLTFAEFSARFLSEVAAPELSKDKCQAPPTAGSDRPYQVNWWAKDKVGRPKHQRSCKAGYAFAAVSVVESALAVFSNRTDILRLSDQEIIECSAEFGNSGCEGGQAHRALDYILENRIHMEKEYPFDEKAGKCKVPEIGRGYVSIDGCVRVGPTVEGLLDSVAVTPVAAAITVTEELRFYRFGVFNPKSCEGPTNHFVTVVGYNLKPNTESGPYFFAKNSWGHFWGDAGFFFIAMGDGKGTCNIAGSGLNYYPTI